MISKRRRITWADFGSFLSQLRRRRGLSQERLAALLGFHCITIWRVEQGKERPTIHLLRGIERMADLTRHEMHWLAAFIELRETHAEAVALGDEVR